MTPPISPEIPSQTAAGPPGQPGHNARAPLRLLTPALLIVVGLFGGGVVLAIVQSLGIAPVTGEGSFTLKYYKAILGDPEFVPSLLTSLWIALASTALAVTLGTITALMLRRSRVVRHGLRLLQASLPVPHLIGAISFGLLLSDSGLLSRLGHLLGLIPAPADFPPLVRDPNSFGIIASYTWKEVPFVAVVTLAALGPTIADYERLARTLAAGAWARLRYVTLPLLAPTLWAAGMLVFAFTVGAYEVPALLGRSYPETLPVLAYRRFSAVELDSRPIGLAVAMVLTALGLLAAVGYTVAARKLATRSSW